MDTATVILLVILIIVVGLFALSQTGSSGGSNSGALNAPTYAGQYGGGCGR